MSWRTWKNGYVHVPKDWRWECGGCGKPLHPYYYPKKASGLCQPCLRSASPLVGKVYMPVQPVMFSMAEEPHRDKRVIEMEDLKAILGSAKAEDVWRASQARYAPPSYIAALPSRTRVVFAVAAWIKAYSVRPGVRDIAKVVSMDSHRVSAELHRAMRYGEAFGFKAQSLTGRQAPEDFHPRGVISRLFYEPNWQVVPEQLRIPRPVI